MSVENRSRRQKFTVGGNLQSLADICGCQRKLLKAPWKINRHKSDKIHVDDYGLVVAGRHIQLQALPASYSLECKDEDEDQR